MLRLLKTVRKRNAEDAKNEDTPNMSEAAQEEEELTFTADPKALAASRRALMEEKYEKQRELILKEFKSDLTDEENQAMLMRRRMPKSQQLYLAVSENRVLEVGQILASDSDGMVQRVIHEDSIQHDVLDVNYKDEANGDTPLILASKAGNMRVIKVWQCQLNLFVRFHLFVLLLLGCLLSTSSSLSPSPLSLSSLSLFLSLFLSLLSLYPSRSPPLSICSSPSISLHLPSLSLSPLSLTIYIYPLSVPVGVVHAFL